MNTRTYKLPISETASIFANIKDPYNELCLNDIVSCENKYGVCEIRNLSVSSARVVIKCCIDSGVSFKSLIDSGAAPSLMRYDVFKRLKKAGHVVRKLTNVDLHLTNASGERMSDVGAHMIRFTMNGKELVAPFVVTRDCTSEAIIGMNIISPFGINVHGASKSISFDEDIDSEQATVQAVHYNEKVLEGAELIMSETKTVQGRTAQLTRCKLVDVNGERIEGRRDIITEVAGIAMAMTVNTEGATKIYIPNTRHSSVTIKKGESLGKADPISCFSPLSSTTARDIARAEAMEAAGISMKGPKLDPAAIRATIDKSVPAAYREEIVRLMMDFSDVISKNKHDLGCAKGFEHSVELKDKEPVYTQQYRVPLEHLEEIKEHVLAWLKCGIVEKAHSKYNSPIFCVPKKGGKGWRVVLDYRKVNEKSMPDRYSIRTIEQCIMEIGESGSKVFSSIDLKSGFWQLPLDKKSREYTAFTLPGHGQVQYTRAPMGLMGSPASFARMMDKVMENLRFVITYIDDCLVHSPNDEVHVDHLRQTMQKLRMYGLKINLEKTRLAARSVQYLGHTISADGVKPGKDKTAAVRDAKLPKNQKQVKSFIGLANFFRGFIPSFATRAAPLYALTRKDTQWEGGDLPEDAVEAFETIKAMICKEPVLQYPTRDGKYHLFTDAAQGDDQNEGGLGACLMQEDKEGIKKAVAFASRGLVKHEKNYPAFLLEMQAATWAMQHFEDYLRGRRWCLHSDHKPMCKLNKVHAKTLNALQMKMLELYPEQRYVDKKNNTVADFLSRYQGLGVAPVDLSWPRINRLQSLAGEDMEDVFKEAEKHAEEEVFKWKRYTVRRVNGTIYAKNEGRKGFINQPEWRIWAPKSLRSELIMDAHNSLIGGHGGIFKTAERIRADFFWPNMESDVREHCKQCKVCQACTNKDRPKMAPLTQLPIPKDRNERVHVDLFGPIKIHGNSKEWVVVMTDAFSKTTALRAIEKSDAVQTAEAIWKTWIATYGVPKMIFSDQGNEFCNTLQKNLWRIMGVEHKTTTPYHPQCNAQAEIFNKTMKAYLTKILAQAKKSTLDWEYYLTALQFSHNTAVHKATKVTPFYATFGYDPRVPLWNLDVFESFKNTDRGKEQANAYYSQVKAQHEARNIVHQNLQHAKDEQKKSFESSYKTAIPEFKEGDRCWVKINNVNDPNPKLAPCYEEGTIVERMSFATYRVRRDARSRKKLATLNASQLKPWTEKIQQKTPEQDQEDEDEVEHREEEEEDGDDEVQEGEPEPTVEEEAKQTKVQPPTGPRTRARAKREAQTTEVKGMVYVDRGALEHYFSKGMFIFTNLAGLPGETTTGTRAAPTRDDRHEEATGSAPSAEAGEKKKHKSLKDKITGSTAAQKAAQLIKVTKLKPPRMLSALTDYLESGTKDLAKAEKPHENNAGKRRRLRMSLRKRTD